MIFFDCPAIMDVINKALTLLPIPNSSVTFGENYIFHRHSYLHKHKSCMISNTDKNLLLKESLMF